MDAFDIFDIAIELLDVNAQKAKVIALCDGDLEKQQNVFGLIDADKSGLTVEDVIAGGLKEIRDGNFDSGLLVGLDANNYHIHAFYKSGGSGLIYKACRLDGYLSKKTAAIKIIKPHLSVRYNYDMIAREADILDALNNKYIVKVEDYGFINFNNMKMPFHRMSFIEGDDICTRFYDSAAHLKTRINVFVQLCEALYHAHTQETPVIHADLKPDNILIDVFGDPKILDFGIAMQLYYQSFDDLTLAKNYAEQHSSKYTCPELLLGKELSIQSDIYSLGLILYEVVTEIKTANFDIKNNLPSENIARVLKKDIHHLWIKELDDIILRATAEDPKKRFLSMKEFGQELTNFIQFKPVKSANKGPILNLYKSIWSHPLNALVSTVSVSAISFILFLLIISYNWLVKTEGNNELKASLAEHYYHLVSEPTDNKKLNYTHFFDKSRLDIQQNILAEQQLKYNETMKLGKVADANRLYDSSIRLYKYAKEISPGQYEHVISSAKYAKALYLDNSYEDADIWMNDLFNSFSKNEFKTLEYAVVYLELFGLDIKYINARFDDDRNDIDIINFIREQHWQNLTKNYQAKLLAALASEQFYYFYGDPFNPTAGQSDDDFNQQIKPMLTLAMVSINEAINLEGNGENIAEYTTLKARISHELKEYAVAVDYADSAIELALNRYGKSDAITEKAFMAKYTNTKFHDLTAATISLENAIASIEKRMWHYDDWLLYTYALSRSHLYAGNFEQSKQQVEKVLSVYNKNKDSLVFKGLDSVQVAIINYLEFTGYRLDDPFSQKLVLTLNEVFRLTKNKYPGYIDDYELVYIKMVTLSYEGYTQQAITLINDLMKQRASGNTQAATTISQLALTAANISMQFNNIEMSLFLGKIAENSMVLSELEKTHSVDKMNAYLQLAEIYQSNKDLNKYDHAMAEARMVYLNHYDVLKNSTYSQAFNKTFITKN